MLIWKLPYNNLLISDILYVKVYCTEQSLSLFTRFKISSKEIRISFVKLNRQNLPVTFVYFGFFISVTVLSVLMWKMTIFYCFPIIAIFVRGSLSSFKIAQCNDRFLILTSVFLLYISNICDLSTQNIEFCYLVELKLFSKIVNFSHEYMSYGKRWTFAITKSYYR